MADRHQFRANWHDYNEGVYFVTICATRMQHYFGGIIDGKMCYSKVGEIVCQCLEEIPQHTSNAKILNSVIMPNHIHVVMAVGAQNFAPASGDATRRNEVNMGCLKPARHGEVCNDFHYNSALAVVVRTFKAACSRRINELMRAQNFAPLQLLQRNYHEHIIRDQRGFDNIMAYVDSNFENWCYDRFNKHRIERPSEDETA